jgi:hypothetical protein
MWLLPEAADSMKITFEYLFLLKPWMGVVGTGLLWPRFIFTLFFERSEINAHGEMPDRFAFEEPNHLPARIET